MKKKVHPVTKTYSKEAWVVSKLDHPITLSYDSSTIIIPPRGKEAIENVDKLGAIPKGILILPRQ